MAATRGARLGEPEIARLLAEAGATFVVADVGHALAWKPAHERFAFWRSEVKGRVVAPEQTTIQPASYPGGRGCLATEWLLANDDRVIVLEAHPGPPTTP